jgi:hypothetical protein
VFFSKVGEELDFSPVEPNKQVLDTNGISYPLSNINSSIRWIKSGTQLIIGTTGGIFRLLPNQFAASVSPTSVRIEMTDDEGCDRDGILVGSSVFFPDQSNSRLMEYNYEGANGNFTNDVSKLLYPIFVDDSIKTVAYQHTPQPRLWLLTEQHRVYVLTYYKAENFYAWSKVEIDGDIQDICVMREGSVNDIDQVWITVKTESGLTHQYLDFSLNCYLDRATVGFATSSFGNPGSGAPMFFTSLSTQLIRSDSAATTVGTTTLTETGANWVVDQYVTYAVTFATPEHPLYGQHFDIVSNTADTLTVTGDMSAASDGDYYRLIDYKRESLTDLHSQGDELDLVVNDVYIGTKTITTTMGNTFAVSVNESELIEKGAMNDTTPGQILNYCLGKKYTAKAKPMNPSYDISNGNVFGTEESRVVTAKALIASGLTYEIGVGDSFQKVALKTLTAYDKEPYSGFDKEKPLPNSMYGEDKIPQIRHSEPYPLTISALITKSDIHV